MSYTYKEEIPFSEMNRETGIRLVYLFVGYGRKIGKFPYS